MGASPWGRPANLCLGEEMNDRPADAHGPPRPGRDAAPSNPAPAGASQSRIKSADIFAGAREVVIEHEGDEYRLRLTSKGKLILTK